MATNLAASLSCCGQSIEAEQVLRDLDAGSVSTRARSDSGYAEYASGPPFARSRRAMSDLEHCPGRRRLFKVDKMQMLALPPTGEHTGPPG